MSVYACQISSSFVNLFFCYAKTSQIGSYMKILECSRTNEMYTKTDIHIHNIIGMT